MEDIMQSSFVPYAMYVISDRALSMCNDGLKPVARRILWTMHTKKIFSSGNFRKVAGIVGETLADYHPHGDRAVADALTRLGQEWNIMVPLIIPQGNFGSADGDPPAAQRYIEAKLSMAGEMLLEDTVSGIVPFEDNYDGRVKEPAYLAGKFPSLLINGDSGIAVSLSSKIPSHNPTEIANAIKFIAKNPNAKLEKIREIVLGPDFPTGGTIRDINDGINNYFLTGQGSFEIRANGKIKKVGQRYQIIFTELPYQVTASSVIESIVKLVKEKKLEGILSAQDYSDSENGLQLVVDLKSGEDPKKILEILFNKTRLKINFHVNMNMLDTKGKPKMMGLVELMHIFCDNRREIIKKKIIIEIEKNKNRLKVLELYRKVSAKIDKVIEVIKNSSTNAQLIANLKDLLKITNEEAEFITNMRIRNISKLERDIIDNEYNSLIKKNQNLEETINSSVKINNIICKEMDEVIEVCGKPRASTIK
jgi:DNA gyrase subunit A